MSRGALQTKPMYQRLGRSGDGTVKACSLCVNWICGVYSYKFDISRTYSTEFRYQVDPARAKVHECEVYGETVQPLDCEEWVYRDRKGSERV